MLEHRLRGGAARFAVHGGDGVVEGKKRGMAK
jgi:hypothetical protein